MLILTEFYRTFQGDNSTDKVTAIDSREIRNERGQEHVWVGPGIFRDPFSGKSSLLKIPESSRAQCHTYAGKWASKTEPPSP